jgi:hypothetical protein
MPTSGRCKSSGDPDSRCVKRRPTSNGDAVRRGVKSRAVVAPDLRRLARRDVVRPDRREPANRWFEKPTARSIERQAVGVSARRLVARVTSRQPEPHPIVHSDDARA